VVGIESNARGGVVGIESNARGGVVGIESNARGGVVGMESNARGGVVGIESVSAKAELATAQPATKAIRLTFIMMNSECFVYGKGNAGP
jgi:hypothetical protein